MEPLPWESAQGGVAQLGEQLLCKQQVVGSNPSASTISTSSSDLLAH